MPLALKSMCKECVIKFRLVSLQKAKEAECLSHSSKVKSLESTKSRLEKEVHSLMEREAKRSKTIEHEMQQAAEMNSRLRKQLSERDEDSRKQETLLKSEVTGQRFEIDQREVAYQLLGIWLK